jgi:hypothetical protein
MNLGNAADDVFDALKQIEAATPFLTNPSLVTPLSPEGLVQSSGSTPQTL